MICPVLAVYGYTYPVLTHNEPICIVVGAMAKSIARIETRQYTRRDSRHQSDFFVADFQHVQFMTGWKGYIRVGRFPCMPVVSTFPACHQSSLRPWVTGSKIQGACPQWLFIVSPYYPATLPVCLTVLSKNTNTSMPPATALLWLLLPVVMPLLPAGGFCDENKKSINRPATTL